MTEKELIRLAKKYHQDQLSDLEERQLYAFEKDLFKRNAHRVFKSSLHEEQIREKLLATITTQAQKPQWKRPIAIAASFAILLSLGLGFFSYESNTTDVSPSTVTISNSTGHPRTILLEDGTKITLNKQSEITYKEEFEGDYRKVTLHGEAYFQVAQNMNKPFIVEADAVQVQVLGTEFNILQNEASVDITVSTGEVQVYNQQESVNLIPNQQVHFDRSTKKMYKRYINHHLSSLWKQERVYLKDINMAEFSTALLQTHGISLDFEIEKLSKLKLTIGYHKQESIEEIIEKVNYINDLKLIKINERTIKVRKRD